MNLDIPLDSITFQRLAFIVEQVGILLAALIASRMIYGITVRILTRLGRTTSLSAMISYLLPRISFSMKWFFLWCSLEIALPFLVIAQNWMVRIHHVLYVLIIASFGWVLTGITLASSEWLKTRYSWSESQDNLKNRSINTQLRVFTHVIVFLIWLVTAISIIMTIPHLRSIGVSLFASAGVAGIVIGMAAGPALSNLIAGIQLALTQPIRIGDQIVIETVSGVVEEIDSTYVVVRLWDLRRLIVPLNYFIQNRFQNWTHVTADSSIATVVFCVDFTMPVDDLRKELCAIVKTLPYWDGKTCRLQVIDLKDNKMAQLQASVSTASPASLYMLQCELREKILHYIQHASVSK